MAQKKHQLESHTIKKNYKTFTANHKKQHTKNIPKGFVSFSKWDIYEKNYFETFALIDFEKAFKYN